jgi:hypothetical protein
MMPEIIAVALAAIILCAVLWWRRLARTMHVERAIEAFRLRKELLATEFLHAANSTGFPRGLIWETCAFSGGISLAREKKSASYLLLTPVAIQFIPIPGSEMETVSAAREPRTAIAIFRFHRGQWVTDGRALFNLSPDDVAKRFASEYDFIATAAV